MNDELNKNETYRRILAAAHKLETIQCNLESVIDFFSVPIVKLYSKLSNDCMRLLFQSDHFKLDHFRKAEELLWRRIYYDIYRFQKTKRQKIKRQDELLIESHFVSGIGFYSTFIVKLRSHYNVNDVRGIVWPFNLSLGPIDNFIADKRLNDDLCKSLSSIDTSLAGSEGKDSPDRDPAKIWAKLAIYRSLVYMGDLARYLLETNQYDYRKLAYDFYLSASRNQPDYGLPFNQLATLAGGQNNNLDAVCNYMRCCLRQKPFERAEGNMRSLFELNKKLHEELEKKRVVMSVSEVFSCKEPRIAAESMVHAVTVNFIKLTSDLWSAILDNSTEISLMKLIAEETRVFFEDLREALELEQIMPLTHHQTIIQEFEPISDGSSANDTPRYITASIMYEFCSISLMLIAKLQRKQSSGKGAAIDKNSALSDLVYALALNLLYYSTSRCQKMIISKLQELRLSQADQAFHDATGLNDRSTSTWTKRSDENINSTAPTLGRKTLSRLRQREAAANYLDRSKATITQNDDSDMSELEETALSTIDALEISSDMSEEADRHVNDLIDLASSSGDDEATSNASNSLYRHSLINVSSIGGLSRPALRPTRSQNYEIHSRPNNLYGSTNSLPLQDLVTGDVGETLCQKAFNSGLINNNTGFISNLRYRCSPAGSSENTENPGQTIREITQAYGFVYKQTYLPTIKVFCDWLLSNGHIIGVNLVSFHAFCKELETLESLLEDLIRVAESKDAVSAQGAFNAMETSNSTVTSDDDDDNLMQNHRFEGPTWKQKYPMSCDYPLLDLEPIKSTHEMNINFDSLRELTDSESGFVSIQCIKAFCHALRVFLNNKDSD